MAPQVSLDVVVPAFNEAAAVAPCAQAFLAALESLNARVRVRLLFVDDGSRDDTWRQIELLRSEQVEGIRLIRNFGKEAAIAAGLEASNADLVAVADCDLEHPPQALYEMVCVALDHPGSVDVVEGVRADDLARGVFGKFGAWGFYWLMRRVSGLDLEGKTDFKLLSRRVVNAYVATSERNKFFRGFVAWLDAPSRRVIFDATRTRSSGRWSLLQLVRYASSNLIGYSNVALSLGMGICLLGSGLGLLAAAKAVFDYLSGHAQAGFSSVIALQFLLHSAGFLLMTLVLAVLSRLLDEVQGRPRYVVDDSSSRRQL